MCSMSQFVHLSPSCWKESPSLFFFFLCVCMCVSVVKSIQKKQTKKSGWNQSRLRSAEKGWMKRGKNQKIESVTRWLTDVCLLQEEYGGWQQRRRISERKLKKKPVHSFCFTKFKTGRYSLYDVRWETFRHGKKNVFFSLFVLLRERADSWVTVEFPRLSTIAAVNKPASPSFSHLFFYI